MGDLSREQALPSIDLGAWLPTDADMAMDLGGLFDNNLDDSYVQSYLSSLPQPGAASCCRARRGSRREPSARARYSRANALALLPVTIGTSYAEHSKHP